MSTPNYFDKHPAIPLDDLPRPGVAISRERWLQLIAAEAENAKLREALTLAIDCPSNPRWNVAYPATPMGWYGKACEALGRTP